jgi:FtsH-binding integral membrane protein
VYCALGLVFYSIFLIIDTMQICGGKSVGGYALDMDEYIMGALMLYIDIIMIFIYILTGLGRRSASNEVRTICPGPSSGKTYL